MMQKRLGYDTQGFGYGPGGCGREPQGFSYKPQGYEQQWFGCACTSIRLRIRVAIWFSSIFPSFFAVRTILLRGKQYLQRRSRLKYVEGYKQYSPFSSLLKI